MKRAATPRKPAPAAARERLASWIASRGLKATRQRDLIVDTFFSQTGHLSVDELVEKAKQRDPSIGAATVYRTMKILTDDAWVELVSEGRIEREPDVLRQCLREWQPRRTGRKRRPRSDCPVAE